MIPSDDSRSESYDHAIFSNGIFKVTINNGLLSVYYDYHFLPSRDDYSQWECDFLQGMTDLGYENDTPFQLFIFCSRLSLDNQPYDGYTDCRDLENCLEHIQFFNHTHTQSCLAESSFTR
jgi:hypothetical protein